VPATGSKTAQQAQTTTVKILYGESDEKMLSTQSTELAKAGHQITAVLNRQGVQDALRNGTYDLVILGSTLSKDDRHHLPYMVRKANAKAKVLVMHAGTHHHEVDAAIDPSMSLPRILEKITALIHSSGQLSAHK
jgi:DNA-binding NtrC family response regulator